MTISTKDAAVLALLARAHVPQPKRDALVESLTGDARKIAVNLTGGAKGNAQVQNAADELRKWQLSLSARSDED